MLSIIISSDYLQLLLLDKPVLYCSWCCFSWAAIQLRRQAHRMERCLYCSRSSARWCSHYENHNEECRIQDGADKKEAAVITAVTLPGVMFDAVYSCSP